MNRKKAPKLAKFYNPEWALAAADAFKTAGNNFFDSVPSKDEASAYVVANLGRFFAASTELLLALELYLKALQAVERSWRLVDEHHDSEALFLGLSQAAQERISRCYSERLATVPGEQTKGFSFGRNPHPLRDDWYPIAELLARHRNAFVVWRYMHETPQDGDFQREIRYFEIGVACDCVKAETASRM